tara:strand:- start:458 stop:1165 length:708 start_codon:yes stop_codon:yes gene_type:complete
MSNYEKILTELRFPVLPKALTSSTAIIETFWPGRFKHWTVENIYVAILHSDIDARKSREQLRIEPKRFVYSLEGPGVRSEFNEKFFALLKKVESRLKPTKYSRVGVRSFSALPAPGFSKIVASYRSEGKFLDPDLSNALSGCDLFKDFALTLEGNSSRLVCGPMQLAQRHPNLSNFSSSQDLPTEFFYADIDCYRGDISRSKLRKEFERILAQNDGIASRLSNYVIEGVEADGQK